MIHPLKPVGDCGYSGISYAIDGADGACDGLFVFSVFVLTFWGDNLSTFSALIEIENFLCMRPDWLVSCNVEKAR